MRRRGRAGDALTGLVVWRCEACGRSSFPRRELCPYCAARGFVAETAGRGTATGVTRHRGVAIACVRVGEDVTLLARAEGAVAVGSQVALDVEDGAAVAAVLRER